METIKKPSPEKLWEMAKEITEAIRLSGENKTLLHEREWEEIESEWYDWFELELIENNEEE